MVIFFLSYCLLFNKITLNKGNVGTNHLNNRILLFVCNRKVIYYYYITLPSITITITFGNFQSITITITITGKSGYYYYNYILHITITPSLVCSRYGLYWGFWPVVTRWLQSPKYLTLRFGSGESSLGVGSLCVYQQLNSCVASVQKVLVYTGL